MLLLLLLLRAITLCAVLTLGVMHTYCAIAGNGCKHGSMPRIPSRPVHRVGVFCERGQGLATQKRVPHLVTSPLRGSGRVRLSSFPSTLDTFIVPSQEAVTKWLLATGFQSTELTYDKRAWHTQGSCEIVPHALDKGASIVTSRLCSVKLAIG